MIEELGLTNFKGWASTGQIRLAPITGLFGSNSSGKTSVLQSLLLLKQTTESADRGRVLDLGDEKSPVALGTYRDIVFGHDPTQLLGFDIAWRTQRPTRVQDPGEPTAFDSTYHSFEVEIDWEREAPAVRNLAYGLGGARFELTRSSKSRREFQLEAVNAGEFRFRRPAGGRRWALPAPVKFYGFPDQVRAYFQNASFLSDLELRLEEMFQNIFYLGPLRDDPHRRYEYPGGRPTDVGLRGEGAITALIASRFEGTRNSRGWVHRRDGRRRMKGIGVEQHVAAWLQELGLIHSFRVEAIDPQETLFRVLVRRTRTSTEVALPDIGFGVSQVLPVLVLLAYVPEYSTVVLEQPEIHLHPAVQARLADVLIETALARNVQVIVESHSEHLLMRLQRRVAEQHLARGIEIKPDDVALYFCDVRQGRSHAEELELDLFGNITNWPRAFFGDALEETALMMKAASRRRASTDG